MIGLGSHVLGKTIGQLSADQARLKISGLILAGCSKVAEGVAGPSYVLESAGEGAATRPMNVCIIQICIRHRFIGGGIDVSQQGARTGAT